MKNHIRILVVILFAIIASNQAYCQSGGWQDNGIYKYMQIPIFSKLQFSQDGERFYTYSSDHYIRYFDSETGEQVDSFYIKQKINYFFFSSDGYTAIYTVMKDIIMDSLFNIKSSHVDSMFALQLDTKKVLLPLKDTVYNNILDYSLNSQIKLIDYNFKSGEILYFLNKRKWVYVDIKYQAYNDVGELYKLEFNKNTSTFTQKQMLSGGQLTSYQLDGDSLYVTLRYTYYSNNNNDNNNGSNTSFYIYDNSKKKVITIKEQNPIESDFFTYSRFSNMILLKSGYEIRYLDPVNYKVLYQRNLKSYDPRIELTNSGLFLAQFDSHDKINIYNSNNLDIMDTITTTNIDNFRIMPANDDIIAWNTEDGKLFRYKSKITRDSINFTTTTNVVHTLTTISFYNLSTIDAKKYIWYINGIKVSENKHLDYIFDKPGVYDIKLELIDNKDQSHILVKKKYIRAIEELKALFSSDVTTGKCPLTVEFMNNSTGTYNSVKWFFGDGDSSLAVNPEHTYRSAGTFDVTLIISDEIKVDTKIIKGYISVDYGMTETITNFITHKTHENYMAGGLVFGRWNDYFNGYSDYKNNMYFTYKCRVLWGYDQYHTSMNDVYDYYYYDMQKDSIYRAFFLEPNTNRDWIINFPSLIDEYDNKLLFPGFQIFNLSDTTSLGLYMINPIPKGCIAHSYDGSTDAFLYDNVLYIAKNKSYYNSFELQYSLPENFRTINVAHYSTDNYLIYYNTNGIDSSYYLALFNGTVQYNKKLFDKSQYKLDKLFKYKTKNEIILAGSKKFKTKNVGYIVFLDKDGNILKDFILSNCYEVLRIHELPDGKILFSANGDSGYCFVLDTNNKQIIQSYVLKSDKHGINYTDIIPANESTLIFSGFVENPTVEFNYPIDYYVFRTNLSHQIFSPPISSVAIYNQSKLELFPNPSKDKITLNLPGIANSSKIELFDALGNRIKEFIYQGDDSNNYTINISDIAPGVYFTKVQIGGKSVVGKFIKLE